jgi:hypothetical protein
VCISAENNPETGEAFEESMLRCLKFLLDNGFDPQTQDIFRGETMLFYAILN